MKTKSNNWKYKIRIKHLFEDETTPELTVKLCKALLVQLDKIKDRVEKSNLTEDDKWHINSELEMIIDSFSFIKDLANGTIPKEDWDEYSFSGDFEGEFNGCLSGLYDLADERVLTNGDVSEKFMWIG